MSALDRHTSTAEETGLLFRLAASPENVAIVRHAVGGLAETLGMDPTAVADLKTIVTEACTNVTVHAYPDEGPLEVQVEVDDAGVTVAVRDEGAGIRPRPDLEESRLRLGLPLIAALSTGFSISGGVERGTEVVMRMDMVSRPDDENGRAARAPTGVHGTAIEVSDERIVAPVISRVLAVLAARTEFPVDRLTDTMLIADALAANAAAAFDDGTIRMLIQDGDGSLDVRLGPMPDGAADRLRTELEIPGLGATLEQLADDVSVEQAADGEYFGLKMRAVRS